MPPVTRVYTTACVITTLAVQMEIVSTFQLYFNPIPIKEINRELDGQGQFNVASSMFKVKTAPKDEPMDEESKDTK